MKSATTKGSESVALSEPVQDVLGPGYESITIDLPDDYDGPIRATVIRHRTTVTPTGRAVLYVHGWRDYYFQTELAEFHTARGEDFYAIDLHRYGRSLLPGQTPYAMRDISDYYPELEAALQLIVDDGHDAVTLNAHSTGGLITPLWLADRNTPSPVDSLVLNSPFLDVRAAWAVKATVAPSVLALSRYRPDAVLPLPESGVYGRSIHTSGDGEWDFDLTWKPISGAPVRIGWLSAILRGQARLKHNLGLQLPVLVLCSTRTVTDRTWSEAAKSGDTVLDADRIADLSTRLGTRVTCMRIQDGMHDVLLSRPQVRERTYREIARWLDCATAT